MRNNQSSN